MTYDIRFKYWAFISYSHHDTRIAKWLVEELSREKVPAKFRSLISNRPTRFSSLFRDGDEAGASGHISETMRTALRQSRNLIIVCSPFAVVSDYVADEIRYFESLGRSDRILCLIASGIPNATDQGNPALECFPEPLRFRVRPDGTQTNEAIPLGERPLAVILGEETKTDKKRALRQMILGVLGISQSAYDALLLRRQLGRHAMATGTAASALVVSAFAWDTYWREHDFYYLDYVR